ncbi:DNA-binding protein, partial [Guyparkeria sp. SCN-R1]
MHYRAVEPAGEYVARLETGAEWRTEIESLATEVEADAAWFTA